MKAYLAAIDCGTSVVKSAIVGLRGEICGLASAPAPLRRSADGHVETDAGRIFDAGCLTLRRALAGSGARPGSVAGIAVTNQRATLVCVSARGGLSGPAISWQDLRGAECLDRLRRRLPDDEYAAITGLPNNAVFTLAKILWIRRRDPALFRATARFVLIQEYLLRRLGCSDFFCDWSNASLTGLLDVASRRWSPRLLERAGIGPGRLAALVPPGQRVGALSRDAARRTGLPSGTPLISGGGDQQCAGVGAGVVAPGAVEVTLGTAAVPLCCSAAPVRDPLRRIMCCAHAVPDQWSLEGLQNAAGSCLSWAARLVNRGERFSPRMLRQAARVPPGSGGLLFFPYLAGDSAPHWTADAKGGFLGLRLTHGWPEVLRAVMEGVSLQTREVLSVFRQLGLPVREIRLTGGCTDNETWNQMQADLYGMPVTTLRNPQASLLGAAVLAACGLGLYPTPAAAAQRMVRIRKTYAPDAARAAAYDEVFRNYCAVREQAAGARVFEASAPSGRATP